MTISKITGLVLAASLVLGATTASAAECVNKGAVATSATADQAKWFALETMVQGVSWGLWPGFVANGQVAGYKIAKQAYQCKPDVGGVTCHGQATFCKS